jgi:serpin B
MPYAYYSIKATVLLPDEGYLGAVETKLSDARLAELMSAMTATKVWLTLPRFRIDSSLSLRSRLQELGVVTAFSSGADLSGISEDKGLFLSGVLQRTLVDVAEWGTEAAASTVAALAKGGLGARGGPIDFRVDRPFLFLISDTETGTVFFLGRVVDPRG